MCNDYGVDLPFRLFVAAFEDLGMAVDPDGERHNLEPRDEIWPTERAPVVRSADGGARMEMRRWGLAPSRAKGPPIINLRSEGRAFSTGRCLVPASHFYEFTGLTKPKTRWRFNMIGEDWFCFAGVVGVGDDKGVAVPAFSLLTAAAGPDVAAIHHRQPVILRRRDWRAWLDASGAASALLTPSAAGTLSVVPAPRERSTNNDIFSMR